MRRAAHLSDDRLVEVCLEGAITSAEATHVAACDQCRQRRARLDAMLRQMSAAATAEADAIFTDDKLAAQQARIFQRLDHEGRPARVIAFPAASPSDVRTMRTRPAGRWIAAAAAAGLAIGLLAGHLVHDLPGGGPARPALVRSAAPRAVPPAAVHAVNTRVADEALLDEIETAIEDPQLAVLRPLHELTPR